MSKKRLKRIEALLEAIAKKVGVDVEQVYAKTVNPTIKPPKPPKDG